MVQLNGFADRYFDPKPLLDSKFQPALVFLSCQPDQFSQEGERRGRARREEEWKGHR